MIKSTLIGIGLILTLSSCHIHLPAQTVMIGTAEQPVATSLPAEGVVVSVCQGPMVSDLKYYSLPAKPDFTHVDPDDQAMIDQLLMNHIKELRDELRAIKSSIDCTIEYR